MEAAALNFRDVMAALGRLPPLALENGFTGARLGMEMAGTVIAVGEGVSLTPGTAVMGFAPGALASTVVTDARLLAPRPPALDPVEAAALPAAYLTASRALEGLAQLREGETVLIHGATGGVGLAAMAIAARCGARVFATAGTPAKRRFAKAQGALDAFDSRGTDFVDRLRAATDGRGADVVLNALAGDALRRGLDALAPFGRFVELGKVDLVANTALPLRPFLRSLSFLTLDADLLLAMAPEGIAEALEEIGIAVAERKLPPLPVQCFDATQAPQAFDRMRRGAHLGKLVITPPQPAESTAVPAPQGAAMARQLPPVPLTTTTRSAETWIIAGGTGGIGVALGAAIAHRRRANVWLLARREPSAEVKAEIARQQAAGADLRLHLGDAAAPETLQALCDQLSAAGAQVAGILHAAVTAEDGPIASQTSARLRAVMRAKTGVARALVQTAERWPECHLIFLGSIAATIGNPHQAAYAAANAALEGIVHRHRQAGRRASLLALAPVCDAGLLTRAPALGRLLEDRLARHFGTRPLTVAMVVEALLTLVDQPRPPAVTTLLGPRIDPAAQPASAGEARLPILEEPAFTGLAQQTAEGEGGHAEAASAAALRAMSPAQRRPALEAELKRLAGSVL
ncbi:MAG: SDR family NAD(P)-dependent oxidoreductase, partial [Pseudomonadota bacterium]